MPIFNELTTTQTSLMYLIDTNVISEIRKGEKTNTGVRQFFNAAITHNTRLYISAITIGELRRGVDLIFHRGDSIQGKLLEHWLTSILEQYQDNILNIDSDIVLLWGKLQVPDAHHALVKLIAATALTYDLCVVTRNVKDFEHTGVRLLNPFYRLKAYEERLTISANSVSGAISCSFGQVTAPRKIPSVTGFTTPSLTLYKLSRYSNVPVGVANPDRLSTAGAPSQAS